MSRRLPTTLCAAAVAALTLLPATASAKNLQAATICGPDACTKVPEDQLSIELVEGGSASGGPERAEPWYRVRVTVGGGGAHESWGFAVLPRGGYTYFDEPGFEYDWARISDSTAATYRRLAGDLQPFAAARLGLPREAQAAATDFVPPPAVTEDEEPGGHGVAIAGAIAGAVLLLAAAISLYRRRPRAMDGG